MLIERRLKHHAYDEALKPVSVPVLDPNASVSAPIRWSMETKRLLSG